MKEIVSTITSKGQVTIPAEIRRHLALRTRDKLVFEIEDDGTVVLRPASYPSVESLRGAAGTLERPLSWEEMRRIAREDALAHEEDSPE